MLEATGLTLFGLGMLGWLLSSDLRRFGRTIVRTEGQVAGNVNHRKSGWLPEDDGFSAYLTFTHDGRGYQIREPFGRASPRAVGSRVGVSFPEGRPDLARPDQPLVRAAFYAIALAALALGLRLLLHAA